MNRRELVAAMGAATMFAATCAEAETVDAETVYELRIYHLNEGKLPLILERFKTRETAIFARLGMHGVGYWTPTEGDLEGKTLIYMLRHKNREAARDSWARFKVDPEWLAVKAESEKDGAFVAKSESTFLKLTEFSPKV